MRGGIGLVLIFGLLLAACGGARHQDSASKSITDDQVAIKTVNMDALAKEANRQEIIEGNLKKGNIDFGQGTIQYFTKENPDSVYGNYPADKEPLAIVDYAPTGELPIEMRRPTIYVMFNNPLVPLAKLGEPITQTPLMKIDPPVAGIYRWYGTKVLSFQPNDTLVDQPRYTVTISADAKSLGGSRLRKDFSFEFHTETVKIVNFYAGNNPDEYQDSSQVPTKVGKFMIVEFNQPIDPDYVKQFINVDITNNGISRSQGFSVARPAYGERLASRTPRGLLVTLNSEPPENCQVVLTLKDKASPKSGYPQRKGDDTKNFHTVTPFVLSSLESYSYDLPRNNTAGAVPVYIQFSHSLDAQAIKQKFSIQVNKRPKSAVSVEAFGSTLRVNLKDIQPQDTISFQATQSVRDIYGRPLSNPSKVVTTVIPNADPLLDFPWGFHHLEAAFAPKFVWAGRNYDAVSFAAEASDRFRFDLRQREDDHSPQPQPVDISHWKKNRVNYTIFDILPFLKNGYGTAYFNYGGDYSERSYKYHSGRPFAIQVTDLGITTRIAYNQVLVWVNSLSTGQPVANALVELSQSVDKPLKSGKTDAAGFVAIPLKSNEFPSLFPADYGYWIVVSASKGDDRADINVGNTVNSYTATTYAHDSPVYVEAPISRVMIFTDRGLYKPGEELALRGIHWLQKPGQFQPYAGEFKLILNDPRSGETLWHLDGTATASGGFATRFKLPSDLEPGTYTIRYTSKAPPSNRRNYDDDDYNYTGVTFTVAQFRKLAFQVNASVPDHQFYMGDDAAVGITASYLAGGAMPNVGYSYYWTRKPQAFNPPGSQWVNYVFGPGNWEGEHTLSNGKGSLSSNGQTNISVKTDDQNAVGSAYDYVLETTVQDVDRQAIANTAHVLVHPASFYIGARFASGSTSGWWSRFVATGQNIALDAVAVDPVGRPWANQVSLTATILKSDWKATEQQGVYGRINTRWDYVETEVSKQKFDAKNGSGSINFQVKDAGDYLLSLEAKDAKGRVSKTVIRFYATGSNWVRRATETPSDIDMICDKDLYLPGETAHILVRSPISEGTYLMTIEREGIYEQKLIHLKGGQSLIDVPVLDKYVPVFYVALTSFTKREAKPTDYQEPDLGRPRSLFGITGLKVSTKPIELDVTVEPKEGAYKPGSNAEVTVKVTQNGQPVANAEVTAIAVDRGVLDLINYHVPDPVDFFYNVGNFPLAVDGDDSRRLLMKPVAYDTNKLTGGDGEKLQERKDFRPLALFEPYVITNAQGEATVTFKLPDSLTTYRLTALALNGSRVGIKEGELLVQNPINVRTALPRRFRNRDTAAAGIVMQNLTKEPQKVEVTVESTILTVGGDKTRTVEIPALGVYELPFILSATTAGEGTISFTIHSNVVNEKLTDKVIVERPLVKEAFTTIGTIARDETTTTEGLIIPANIAPGYGSLNVQASSTMRPYIEPALNRLLDNPWWDYDFYDNLLTSFAGVYTNTLDKQIQGLLADLKNRQQGDGGIYTGSYAWQPYLSDPYISLLTAHFIEFAASRSYNLNKAPDLSKLLVYLDNRQKEFESFDPYYHAYNNYILAVGGKKDAAYLKRTESMEDKLGLGGYGLLTQAYLAAQEKGAAERSYRRCKNFVMISTQNIDLKDTYEVANYWSSELAEMAILLKNAQEMAEDPGFVQRVAGALNRSERHWQSENDDLWTLLGFIPLLDAEGPSQGTAAVELNNQKTKLAGFDLNPGTPKGQKTLEFNAVPLQALQRGTLLPMVFSKTGDTPVYYTMIMRYALPNETAIARDEGVEVNQRYETLDGTLVTEKNLKLGETYRVRVDLSTTKRRQRLELMVPIPNGVEIVDPTFVTSGAFKNQGGTNSENINRETVYGDTIDVSAEGEGGWDDNYWYWYWYRPDTFALDNMMVYRWTDFYAGARTVTFLVRVTTPGIYPTPGANASLQFEPEVFGRSEGKLFVIKP